MKSHDPCLRWQGRDGESCERRISNWHQIWHQRGRTPTNDYGQLYVEKPGNSTSTDAHEPQQTVTRAPEKREVVGSIPTLTTSVNQRKRPADVAGGKAKMSICGNDGGNDGGNRRIIRLRSAEIPFTLLVTLPKACLGSDGPPKRVVSYFQEIRGTSSRLH
jgi:hypothetical protein